MTAAERWEAAARLAFLVQTNHRAEAHGALLYWTRKADAELEGENRHDAILVANNARKMLIVGGVL